MRIGTSLSAVEGFRNIVLKCCMSSLQPSSQRIDTKLMKNIKVLTAEGGRQANEFYEKLKAGNKGICHLLHL